MRKFIILFTVLYSLLSCAEQEEFDYFKRKNMIVGEWDIAVNIVEVKADTVNSILNYSTAFNLYNDGTGSYPSFFDTTRTVEIEWFYQYDPEFVLISERLPNNKDNLREFRVLELHDDEMLWEFRALDSEGIVDYWLNTYTMTRK